MRDTPGVTLRVWTDGNSQEFWEFYGNFPRMFVLMSFISSLSAELRYALLFHINKKPAFKYFVRLSFGLMTLPCCGTGGISTHATSILRVFRMCWNKIIPRNFFKCSWTKFEISKGGYFWNNSKPSEYQLAVWKVCYDSTGDTVRLQRLLRSFYYYYWDHFIIIIWCNFSRE